jgi:hypothetical protein
MVDCCEFGNEHAACIKQLEFIGYLNDYHHLTLLVSHYCHTHLSYLKNYMKEICKNSRFRGGSVLIFQHIDTV